MAKNNKICVVCNTPYRYCNDCREFLNYPSWMSMFCSEECLRSYEIMSSYENGQTDKETARKILNGFKGSGKYKNYKKSFATTYAKIMMEDALEKDTEDNKSDEPTAKEETEFKKTEAKMNMALSQSTASQFKSNVQSESKKVYPKAVSHKHGK